MTRSKEAEALLAVIEQLQQDNARLRQALAAVIREVQHARDVVVDHQQLLLRDGLL